MANVLKETSSVQFNLSTFARHVVNNRAYSAHCQHCCGGCCIKQYKTTLKEQQKNHLSTSRWFCRCLLTAISDSLGQKRTPPNRHKPYGYADVFGKYCVDDE